MIKNIIITILVIFLITSVMWGWFLEQGKASLQDQVNISDSEVATLQSEVTTLQNKIGKGLAYAQALNLFLDAARKQAGLQISQQFSSDMDWLLALTAATKATADSELQGNLGTIAAGGTGASTASILYMSQAASSIV